MAGTLDAQLTASAGSRQAGPGRPSTQPRVKTALAAFQIQGKAQHQAAVRVLMLVAGAIPADMENDLIVEKSYWRKPVAIAER